MNSDTGLHRPRDAFRDSLEAEISRALRREERAHAGGRTTFVRTMQRMVPLLGVLAVGAVIGAAPAQIREARMQRELLEIAQRDETAAGLRLGIARDALALVVKRFEVAAVSRGDVVAAETEVKRAENEVAVRRLNVEEIRETSAAPRDEITAPLVGGRDFVRQRLVLRFAAADALSALAEANLRTVEARERLETVSNYAVREAELEFEKAKSYAEMLAAKTELRDRYLRESLPVERTARDARVLELQQELVVARKQVDLAERRAALMRTRYANAMVIQMEVYKAELELHEAQNKLASIEFEIRQLRGG